MNITVKFYDVCKYNPKSKKIAEHTYNNVKSIETKVIPDEEILEVYDCTDPYKEYTILTFTDGETATFRNSLCDMFRAF